MGRQGAWRSDEKRDRLEKRLGRSAAETTRRGDAADRPRFPAHYRDVLEQYFKRLASEKTE